MIKIAEIDLLQDNFLIKTLHKIPSFHLTSWCGNFVERHSFRIVSGDSPETVFPQNFHTMKLGEITVFYVVKSNRTRKGAIVFVFVYPIKSNKVH